MVQGCQKLYSHVFNSKIQEYRYKYTNAACDEVPEIPNIYAIFFNSCWFKDVKNYIPKCSKIRSEIGVGEDDEDDESYLVMKVIY